MAHAFAADAAVGDLDAAAVADHPLVLHAAVLAAGALPVFLRPEDALAEQTIFFGAIRAVVDRFRFLDFAEGPAADVMRAGQTDAHSPVVIDPVVIGFASTSTHGTHSLKDSKVVRETQQGCRASLIAAVVVQGDNLGNADQLKAGTST